MKESLPLATIQTAVIDFVRGREDVVLFGAQAVNVYVSEPRATQDVDLMSTRAAELAEELREFLSQRFHIAARVRDVKDGLGYRIYQVQKTGNRHLVDVRSVPSFPDLRLVDDVQVLTPTALIASKVIAYHQRRGRAKSGTDMRDLMVLLLAFPDLKRDPGPVTDSLLKEDVSAETMEEWREMVAREIQPLTDEDEF
ncbi:MAG: nucleotidyl transferase AbiEii/AbiGii toxin family protein [Blastocatellia bacterium]|nr:nucleotidyl transferase AbiEii/AbiGii toxin family protein [Blastocatellia bacterium]